MKSKFKCVVVLLVASLLTGCASHKVLLVARRNSVEAPTSTAGIALVSHTKPRPEEQRLKLVLTEALQHDGLNAKSAKDADYVLAYWIDESWDEVVPGNKPGRQEEYTTVVGTAGDPTGGRMAGESFHRESGEKLGLHALYISTKGVKLLLYSNRAQGAARLTPVWEGYIEVGSAESSERLAEAVSSLLVHFGKDFTGHVRLQK